MSIPVPQARRPRPALAQFTLAALLLDSLIYGVDMLLIGQLDLEIGVVALCLLLAAGLIAMGWRWSPALAVLLVGASVIGGLPYRLHHLAHPGTSDFFVTAVLNLACDLAIVIGGIGATIESYRSARRHAGWPGAVTAGLLGMVAGALLIGGLVAAQVTASTMPLGPGGQPTVRLAPGSFEPDVIQLPRGGVLTLVNHAAIPHVVANGTWAGAQPRPRREPGAPAADHLPVNEQGALIELGPFSTPGSYQFYCPLHPGMSLTVVVE